jgi:1,4-alpha-glucan branching enzyme
MDKIEFGEKDLDKFTKSYQEFGIHINNENSVTAKEWAPGAQQVYLTGDFSK